MGLERLRERHARLEAWLDARLPQSLKVGAGVLYLHTQAADDGPLDRLAAPAGWDRWHDASIALLLALQVGGLALLTAGAALALTQPRATATNDPANAVAIPGINAFMPLAAAPFVIAALVLATVVHEAGHAIATRRADVPVDEYGIALLLGVVPLAGYVLPGPAIDAAPRRTRLRVYAAGVANNLVLAAVAFAVLLLPWTASATAAYHAYFGWTLTGGAPPTAASIAALGPVSNLAFWTALLSANFGVLNALPVAVLDGGRVLSLALEAAGERVGRPLPRSVQYVAVHGLGAFAVAAGVVAVIGPHLRI